MPSGIVIEQRRDENILYLQFAGEISEKSEYPSLDIQGLTEVVFTLKDIDLINSTGIQKWVEFLSQFSQEISFVIVDCNSRVINQINQFSGFLGEHPFKIMAFTAPYFCDSCDESFEIKIKTVEVDSSVSPPKPPKKVCPKCGDKTEFDSVPKKYLKFLAQEKPAA